MGIDKAGNYCVGRKVNPPSLRSLRLKVIIIELQMPEDVAGECDEVVVTFPQIVALKGAGLCR